MYFFFDKAKNPILDVEKIALIDSKATFQFFVIDEKGKDKINEDIRWLAKMKRKEMSTFCKKIITKIALAMKESVKLKPIKR